MARYDDIKTVSQYIGKRPSARKRNPSGKTGTVEKRGKGLGKKSVKQ